MKTKLHCIILAVTLMIGLSPKVNAQYSFKPCSSLLSMIGDSVIFTVTKYDSTAHMTSGASGANVSWDYSNLVADTIFFENHHYLNPSATPYAADFPKANWCDYLKEDSTYTYEIIYADSALFIGNKSNNECSYPVWKNMLLQVCPTSFGATWQSGYFANSCINVGTAHDYRKGYYTYDAYGSLKLPTVTFPNTARIKNVVTMSDTMSGLPYLGTEINILQDTMFTWYDVSTDPPAIVFTYLYEFGTTLIPSYHIVKNSLNKIPDYFYSSNNPSALNKVNFTPEVKLYPNPSINTLTIECSPQSIIEIINTQGQQVKTYTATGSKTCLDVTALPSGLYIVEVKTKNGITIHKFVKE